MAHKTHGLITGKPHARPLNDDFSSLLTTIAVASFVSVCWEVGYNDNNIIKRGKKQVVRQRQVSDSPGVLLLIGGYTSRSNPAIGLRSDTAN